MKHQYYGDTRDLFKYDLIQEIVQNLDCIKQFTFIPMLTPDDRRTDGNRTDYSRARAGFLNERLVWHMKQSLKRNLRDIRQIKPYFIDQGIRMNLHKANEYYRHRDRKTYFAAIHDDHLKDSLVLVDPDNGLEVKHATEKHILFDDVRALCDRMADASVLMIFQFFPRCKREKYVNGRCRDLWQVTGIPPLWIHDNQILFFFLTGCTLTRSQLQSCLHAYGDRYPLLALGSL